jgi:hypothetical protein
MRRKIFKNRRIIRSNKNSNLKTRRRKIRTKRIKKN